METIDSRDSNYFSLHGGTWKRASSIGSFARSLHELRQTDYNTRTFLTMRKLCSEALFHTLEHYITEGPTARHFKPTIWIVMSSTSWILQDVSLEFPKFASSYAWEYLYFIEKKNKLTDFYWIKIRFCIECTDYAATDQTSGRGAHYSLVWAVTKQIYKAPCRSSNSQVQRNFFFSFSLS